PLHKCCDPGLCFQIALCIPGQDPNPPHLVRLLRPRGQRPHCRRAPQQSDELSPPHSPPSSAMMGSEYQMISRSAHLQLLHRNGRGRRRHKWVNGGHGIDVPGGSLVPQLATEVVALTRFSEPCQFLTLLTTLPQPIASTNPCIG